MKNLGYLQRPNHAGQGLCPQRAQLGRHTIRKLTISQASPLPRRTSQLVEVEPSSQQASWLQRVFNLGRSKAIAPEICAVTADELHAMLQEATATPLLVIFTAAWCGPCKLVMDSIHVALKRMEPGNVRVVKIDVEAEEVLATQVKVGKLPTLMFCGPNKGKPAIRTQGLVSDKLIEDLIRNRSPFAGNDLERSVNW